MVNLCDLTMSSVCTLLNAWLEKANALHLRIVEVVDVAVEAVCTRSLPYVLCTRMIKPVPRKRSDSDSGPK